MEIERGGVVVWWRLRAGVVGELEGCVVFFFFQAEDGIRDVAVTGVQTCALPICHVEHARRGVCARQSRLGQAAPALWEIGRASCKGKSVDLGGRRIIKKKKKKIIKTTRKTDKTSSVHAL